MTHAQTLFFSTCISVPIMARRPPPPIEGFEFNDQVARKRTRRTRGKSARPTRACPKLERKNDCPSQRKSIFQVHSAHSILLRATNIPMNPQENDDSVKSIVDNELSGYQDESILPMASHAAMRSVTPRFASSRLVSLIHAVDMDIVLTKQRASDQICLELELVKVRNYYDHDHDTIRYDFARSAPFLLRHSSMVPLFISLLCPAPGLSTAELQN